MTNVNVTNFRKNIFEYINSAVEYGNIVNISSKNGNAVLVSEDEFNGLVETVYLMSIPGMKERLIEGLNATDEDMEEFSW